MGFPVVIPHITENGKILELINNAFVIFLIVTLVSFSFNSIQTERIFTLLLFNDLDLHHHS